MNAQIMVVVFLLVFGGFAGSKISSLNPFSNKNKVAIAKSESSKEEYFRDKVKQIEYRSKESYKNKTPVVTKRTIGDTIGNFIDTSLRLLFFLGIFGIGLALFATDRFVRVIKKLKSTSKTLVQVVRGNQKAKNVMNGEKKKLDSALKEELDEESKKIVSDIKHENNIK